MVQVQVLLAQTVTVQPVATGDVLNGGLNEDTRNPGKSETRDEVKRDVADGFLYTTYDDELRKTNSTNDPDSMESKIQTQELWDSIEERQSSFGTKENKTSRPNQWCKERRDNSEFLRFLATRQEIETGNEISMDDGPQAYIRTMKPRLFHKMVEKGQLKVYRIDTQVLFAQNNKEMDEDDTEDDLTGIPCELVDYLDVFSKVAALKLPAHRSADLAIDLEPGKFPPLRPIYKMPPVESIALKEYLTENLQQGFIESSTSPFGAPILFVKKPDGSLRLCVDYRGLNSVTRKNVYPLPIINELFNEVQGARYFSKLDLRGAYNLLRVRKGDEWKTAFRTRFGHFQYKVMPFGLTNAPACFQSFINDIFKDYLNEFVIVYLDDICIFSKDKDEHTKHIKIVLDLLRQNKLYAKFSKCEFYQDSIEFIGHRISEAGIEMCPSKIEALEKWPILACKDDILSFLGLANYYRRFIKNFSDVALPLTRQLKKTEKFVWGIEQQLAFDQLKNMFTTGPILRYADPDRQYIIETDASDFAAGAVLLQKDVNGEKHPIAYYSRKFIPAEINYEIYDKELLAIKLAFSEWRQYIMGSPMVVRVVTDHKTLEYFLKTKSLTRRQARWSLFLGEFWFQIEYRKGSENTIADALSRRPDLQLTEEEKVGKAPPLLSKEHFVHLNKLTAVVLSLLEQIKEGYTTDQFIQGSEGLLKKDADTLKDENWDVIDGIWLYDEMIYVPDGLSRLAVLRRCHDEAHAGHFGFRKTLELIRREFYWPLMTGYVQHYVDSCEVCNRAKNTTHKPYGLLQPVAITCRPWSTATIDFVGPLPVSDGYNMICTMTCHTLKQVHFARCLDTVTAAQTVDIVLENIIRLHGTPDIIISDRGTQFKAKFWQEFFRILGTKVKLSTSFHPQTDGSSEIVNKSLGQYLRCFVNYLLDDWSRHLGMCEFAFNNSYHTSIKCSPFWALYGYHPKLNVDLVGAAKGKTMSVPEVEARVARLKDIQEELVRILEQLQINMKRSSNAHRLPGPNLKVGDRVWLSLKNIKSLRGCDKLDFKRQGPFRITKKIGEVNYELELPHSMRLLHNVFHVDLLELVVENLIEGRVIPPPPPIEIETFMEFEVEEILDSRIRHGRVEYLVKWKGYGPEENSFQVEEDLGNAKQVLLEFHQRYPRKPSKKDVKKVTKRRRP